MVEIGTREYTSEEFEQRKRMMACLGQVSLFKDTDITDKEDIIDVLQTKQFPKGQIIFNPGDNPDGVYLIESGEVVVELEQDGNFKELSRLKENDYFGEMSILSNRPRVGRVTVTSEPNANFFFLPEYDFEKFLATNLNVFREVVKVMTSRLAETSRLMPFQPH